MYIFKREEDLRKFLSLRDTKIGLVPTMGALHEGHISLIKTSLNENETTVCSIYVNPTQFNDPQDFKLYPVTLERDIELLIQAGNPVLFLPSTEEVYIHGTNHLKDYDLGYLNTILEGPERPGHFQGVCNVVHRLLEMVQPDHLYLGEKDFQQCAVIKRMVETSALAVKIHTCATLRHEDGLAMSSRNARLSPEARKIAPSIYKNLIYIKKHLQEKPFEQLKDVVWNQLLEEGFETEYLALADADDLSLLNNVSKGKQMVLLIATRLEGVRLIDNLIIPAL